MGSALPQESASAVRRRRIGAMIVFRQSASMCSRAMRIALLKRQTGARQPTTRRRSRFSVDPSPRDLLMLCRIEHLSHGNRRTIKNMVFSDAVRQPAPCGHRLSTAALKGRQDTPRRKGPNRRCSVLSGDGEIVQLSDGLTVADIYATRTGAKVKPQSA